MLTSDRSHHHDGAACEPLESRTLLAAGDLDPAFDGDGKLTLAFPGGTLRAMDVAMQYADGKMIVVGVKGDNAAAARLNPDGSLDPTFGQGGIWEWAAQYTPTAMVAEFQHGLVRADVLLVTLVLIVLGLALATIWTALAEPVPQRAIKSAVAVATAGALIVACASARASWDLSENRMNSFALADERALGAIPGPLRIEVDLAPEDPRRSDLDRRALAKLRRVMPSLEVNYVAESGTGLFEQARDGYGEIRYALNGRTATSRATTVEGVLETIYTLAGITPVTAEEEGFRGHPLAAEPRGAGLVFYGAWPATVVAAVLARSRRQS